MGVTARIAAPDLVVEPGSVAECQVRLRNSGTVVDQISLKVVGDAAAWATVEPSVVSLFPEGEQDVLVRFAPPREPTVPAGTIPFAMLAACQEQEARAVEEGRLTVGSFTDTASELRPSVSKGRVQARHRVVVDNAGNVPVTATLLATDPAEVLQFDFDPATTTVAPGTATLSRLRVRPTERFWWGPTRTHAFEVTVASDGEEPITLAGTMSQQPLIRWLPKALLLVFAVLLAFLALKATVLQSDEPPPPPPPPPRAVPAVLRLDESAARDRLAKAGFDVRVSTVDDEAPKGTVVGQDPPAGTELEKGSEVEMVVSNGFGKTGENKVPSVVGLTQDEARLKLEALGFAVRVTEAQNPAPRGAVFAQNPAADTTKAPGSEVEISVSLGHEPPPPPVEVPDLSGRSLNDAENALARLNLTSSYSEEPSDGVPAGAVMYTVPGPGEHVEVGTEIHLVVSTGSPPPSCNIALQAYNGQWLSAEDGGGGGLLADRNAVFEWETFCLVDLGGGSVALQTYNGYYVVALGGGGGEVNAKSDSVTEWETFYLRDLGGGAVALQAYNGQYLTAEGGGGGALYADRDYVAEWETFYLQHLP